MAASFMVTVTSLYEIHEKRMREHPFFILNRETYFTCER
jgi:hypothetical protein